MGLPWFQLKTVVDTEVPERFKQSKASNICITLKESILISDFSIVKISIV